MKLGWKEEKKFCHDGTAGAGRNKIGGICFPEQVKRGERNISTITLTQVPGKSSKHRHARQNEEGTLVM